MADSVVNSSQGETWNPLTSSVDQYPIGGDHSSWDIDKIDDPMKRNATISFINNFGQTPKWVDSEMMLGM